MRRASAARASTSSICAKARDGCRSSASQRLAQRIAPFGWHIEFLMHVDEFPDLDRMLDGLPVDVVFGHLGYVRAEKGTDVPGFQALLRLLRGGRAWVKFTGPYRISSQPLPHADTVAFAHALLATAPDRIVWGSDWPHVMTRWTIPMPNDGALADLLLDWIPDAASATACSPTIRPRSTAGRRWPFQRRPRQRARAPRAHPIPEMEAGSISASRRTSPGWP